MIGKCFGKHRATEFIRFLRPIDEATPSHLDLHLIPDNYATHKTTAVRRWPARHPSFHVHFTPTYFPWINLVEAWFSMITRQAIRRESHGSTRQLKASINAYIAETNANPQPFIWTKSANEILNTMTRFCLSISDSGH